MGFDVVFVHKVDAQLVRQLQQQRVGRVVGGAHRVDIELLADQQVALDVVGGQRVAVARVGVVVVDALELDLAAVEQKYVAADLHRAEAQFFLNAACGSFVIQIVQNRVLGIPFCNIQIGKHGAGGLVLGGYGGGARQPVTLQGKGDGGVGVGFGGQGQGVATVLFFGLGVNIPEVRRLLGAQQHIAENAVVAEHILIFQIGAVAPAMYHRQQLVLPGLHLAGQVKFGGVVRTLGIADVLAVQIEVQAGRNAQKGDNDALVGVRHVKKAAVDAHKVVLLVGGDPARAQPGVAAQPRKDPPDLVGGGDDRRLVGELVAVVDVERAVIAAELPAGGDIQLVKGNSIGVQFGGQLGGQGVKFKIPDAVQALHFGRSIALALGGHGVGVGARGVGDKVAARRQVIDAKNREGVIVGGVQTVFHGGSPCRRHCRAERSSAGICLQYTTF